jgi:hypothetical protein
MSESILERLNRFTPDASGLDRDTLLFACGRSSVRPDRRWKTATSLLAASQALSLVLMLPRPNSPTNSPATSVAVEPAPRRFTEAPESDASPIPPYALSARHSLREAALETRPDADVTFINQEPPLRAGALPPASLMN